MSAGTQTLLLQLVITLVGTGGLFGLFTIVQTRRKLTLDADKVGADATAVLTGEALDMVREARDQAKEARDQAREARQQAEEAREAAKVAAARMDLLRDHIIQLEQMIRLLGQQPPPFTWPTSMQELPKLT